MKRIYIIAAMLAVGALLGCEGPPSRTTDSPVVTSKMGVSELSPVQARPGVEAAYAQFIDVRTPEEYASGHAYRARNIPIDTLRDNLDRLDKNEPVYVICQTGRRSKEAAEILNAEGFLQVISITGGTDAWKEAGLRMAE